MIMYSMNVSDRPKFLDVHRSWLIAWTFLVVLGPSAQKPSKTVYGLLNPWERPSWSNASERIVGKLSRTRFKNEIITESFFYFITLLLYRIGWSN